MAMTNDYNEYTEQIDPQGRKWTFRVFSGDQRRLLSECLHIAAAGSLGNGRRHAKSQTISSRPRLSGVAYLSKDRLD
jgi:hypothetical protein